MKKNYSIVYPRRAGKNTLKIMQKRYNADLISIIEAFKKHKVRYNYITFGDINENI